MVKKPAAYVLAANGDEIDLALCDGTLMPGHQYGVELLTILLDPASNAESTVFSLHCNLVTQIAPDPLKGSKYETVPLLLNAIAPKASTDTTIRPLQLITPPKRLFPITRRENKLRFNLKAFNQNQQVSKHTYLHVALHQIE